MPPLEARVNDLTGTLSAEQRAALGSAYLARYPQGRFAPELLAQVGGREDQFWEERRSSEAGV